MVERSSDYFCLFSSQTKMGYGESSSSLHRPPCLIVVPTDGSSMLDAHAATHCPYLSHLSLSLAPSLPQPSHSCTSCLSPPTLPSRWPHSVLESDILVVYSLFHTPIHISRRPTSSRILHLSFSRTKSPNSTLLLNPVTSNI
jgi:hypothetical protein